MGRRDRALNTSLDVVDPGSRRRQLLAAGRVTVVRPSRPPPPVGQTCPGDR